MTNRKFFIERIIAEILSTRQTRGLTTYEIIRLVAESAYDSGFKVGRITGFEAGERSETTFPRGEGG